MSPVLDISDLDLELDQEIKEKVLIGFRTLFKRHFTVAKGFVL